MANVVPGAGDGVRPAMDSYRPHGYGMSNALRRARRPYLMRNTLVGTAISVFAVSVYLYSIRAVKQEDFSDIDILAPALGERAAIKSIEDEQKEKEDLKALGAAAVSKVMAGGGVNVTSRDSPVVNDERGGILPPAVSSTPDSVAPVTAATTPSDASSRGFGSKILPLALHPTQGTVVWDAPSVDKVGTVWDRRPVPGEKRQV
ncbi:hypothetical protein CALVIDRAFT_595541 [Calocera viscosa TUFC12733]|uniref:Cytochrome c oxidase assembly factor 3 n=1 Tax=Calocera viscosa (strain TUFC12733) TaxID=1330018 RepID=A0A167QPZ2_CALVF|nr:hypothetical protein CALVIDRAFT_595541 [Calocera viscosa TUFC12733]